MKPAGGAKPDHPDLAVLEQALGHKFINRSLIELALTHPSVAADHELNLGENNQRLEYLGDAVLQLVLSSTLYERLPQAGEGTLTKARAHLVNRHSLASQARALNLGAFLRLSHGEEQHGGRERLSALADCFEAVTGAIFLDAGIDAARQFVLKSFTETLKALQSLRNSNNPKGDLQELLQADSKEAPRYEVKSTSGPDHDRMFECAVYHVGRELARGTGKSKKEAESQAARSALMLTEGCSPASQPG
jgi:ribonuclease III